MFIDELKRHIQYLRRKDEQSIKESEELLKCKTRRHRWFRSRVTNLHEELLSKTGYISAILKEYVGNELGDFLFERTFNDAVVINTLNDRKFVAMLTRSHLIMRTLNLNRYSKGQVKLRIYIAILNFDNYKNNEAGKQ